ncbi:helix-turn-helix domain-containing protein [Neobacillus sp. NPDC097160]|uniref:helix-turn-helix domain-containing protein n=1 Tax=Neobacillus sp. NPDC097160 TaxID=3364298 RepID=UPI00382D66C5
MNGQQLNYIRRAVNLSQKELAEKVEVSLVTINRYEKGRQEPQPSTIRRLQKALRYTEEDLVTIAELLEGDADKRSHARLKMKLQQQADL